MKLTFSFAFIFLQILIFVNASGFYSIVAPGTIQSQYEYSVSVTLHENSEPATIKVGITGPSYNETKTVDVAPSNTEVVNFNVPKLKEGQYQLQSEGIKGLIFKNSTELNYKNKEPKVYIQTDKAVYKPGDLVQYRIVVLDENTRPAKLEEPLRLGIKDGARNHIKQINDIKLSQGVYSGEFQLSEQPVLGDWMLEVSLGKHDDDTKTEKKFEVAKYVLPKFSVDIETAKDVAYADGAIKVTLRSKYTYGKPVKGKATVTVDANHGVSKSEKTIDVDGKGYVEFNMVKDLQLEMNPPNDRPGFYRYSYIPPINILAVMTEEYTGNKQNKTATINLHQSRYNIEVPNNVYEYEANKSFEMTAYVKNLDGSPVQDDKQVATLRVNKNRMFYYQDVQPIDSDFVFESKLDNNGKAVFKVTVPDVGYHSARIIFADKTHYLPSLTGKQADEKKKDEPKADEEDVGPLKLVMKNEKPKLGEDVTVDVKSNKNIPYYVYAIVARGNIIKQEHVKVPEKTQSHSFSFKPTFEMVPEFNVYVYFVLDGELVFQEMSINLPREFENKIEITAPKQAKPSEEVTLNIKTDPNSFVGLLGVDQSVLLLQSGNDLDSKKIIDDLNQYNTATPYIRGYGTYPGKTSGLVTLTNANYPYSTDLQFDDEIQYLEDAPFEFQGLIVPESIAYEMVEEIATEPPNDQTTDQIIIRKDFPESWIYQTLNSTPSGEVSNLNNKQLMKNVPTAIRPDRLIV